MPDDRIVASALRLQSEHPAATVVLVTSDLNLQNKADAARLPYVETPKTVSELTARFDATTNWETGEGGTGPVMTLKNVGKVAARDLEYSVGDPPDTPGTTWTAWPVESRAARTRVHGTADREWPLPRADAVR